MPNKLKARDIVAGWPRGHSTMSVRSFARRMRWAFYTEKMKKQIEVDADYHRQQQNMLDRHISEYRRPTPAWLARRMMASGGCGIVIATCGETPSTITLGEPERPWSFVPSKEPPIAGFTAHPPDPKWDRILFTNVVVDEREQRGEMKRPK